MQVTLTAAFLAFFLLPGAAAAAELSSQTRQSFDDYVARAKSGLEAASASPRFLWIDSSPRGLQRVRDGALVAAPVGQTPLKVPGGLIHDWIGAEFIPGVTIDDVIGVLRDYPRYK